MRTCPLLPQAILALLVLLLAAGGGLATAVGPLIISQSTTGTVSWYNCSCGVATADGRLVAFGSADPHLVATDTNGTTWDVFVRDTVAGTTELVSVATDGSQGNEDSGDRYKSIAISADGRFVVFESLATNLAPGTDTNNNYDMFVRDRLLGVTRRISESSPGVAADKKSMEPALSADGRYIAYRAYSNLIAPDDTNGYDDAILYDQVTGASTVVSRATDGTASTHGAEAISLSANGRYLSWISFAGSLVPDDENGVGDVFERSLVTGVTQRVSVASDGTEADDVSGYTEEGMGISGDGRYTAFQSSADNLWSEGTDNNNRQDVFVHDLQTGVTELISKSSTGLLADLGGHVATISQDGRYVCFTSRAANLVTSANGYDQVYIHDRVTHVTALLSKASDGTIGDESSWDPALSADGRYATFRSNASNLATPAPPGSAYILLAPNPLFVPPSTTPAAPTLLTGVPAGGTKITLTWTDNSNNETGFRVERSTTSATEGFVQVAATAANTPTFVDWGLAPGTTYYYRVKAYNPLGNSAYSNTYNGSWVPSGFAATPLASNSVRLSWNQVTDETGFTIQRKTATTAYAQVAAVAANATAYTDGTCTKTTAYTYRIRCNGAAGSGPWVEIAVTTPSFDDVLPANGQYRYVEAMRREGITAGCQPTPPLYCPDAPVTRGQMAVFLCRAAGWDPLNLSIASFTDVPKTHPQFGYVEQLKAHGVTAGCTPTTFCPDSPVTRGQMAVFLCRAAGVPTQNPATPTFTDVPKTSGQYTYVEGMFTANITAGCVTTPPRQYCPSSSVTRGQMAVFLCRAFDISI